MAEEEEEEKANGEVEKEEEEEGGNWRNRLQKMMDEIKKVQELPKVRNISQQQQTIFSLLSKVSMTKKFTKSLIEKDYQKNASKEEK